MPAGDFDYDAHGGGYATQRQTEPQIAARVERALGEARTVLNVGAGAGSYEPARRYVLAVEPSAAMRAQRPPDRAPAVDATAERLPFDDASFDAAMAIVTVHQWPEAVRGLAELRRVARHQVVVLTFDPEGIEDFWLAEHAPDMLRRETARFPGIPEICRALGGPCETHDVPIPLDCADGFIEAYYGRPEELLRPEVRAAQSSWHNVSAEERDRAVASLAEALRSGEWDRRHGHLRLQPEYSGSLRLVVSGPEPGAP